MVQCPAACSLDSLSAPSGNIKPVLCNITNTTATAEATRNKDNIISCPSPFRNVLNPNGLIAKIIKPTKIEVSTVIPLTTYASYVMPDSQKENYWMPN
jgi:hypothetical protein